MKEDTEEKGWLTQAMAGDRQAFARLLEHSYDRIYRLAYRWCGVREDAEEIAQEVCIKLARAISTLQHPEAFSSWLYGLVLNTARDFHRQQQRQHGQQEYGLDLSCFASHEPNPEQSLQARLIHRCIALLPDPLRMAVLLVHAQGLNHRQAGDTLCCAEGTISWRLSQARKQLTACLNQGVPRG
ncbi:MAG: RNA polymerase sigma factor [Magnetococcales bacterium]|nr:RNA polymerase sigma factor [Magnetococcales bacterium]